MKTWFDRWMNWMGGMADVNVAPAPVTPPPAKPAAQTWRAEPVEWLEFRQPLNENRSGSHLSFGHDSTGALMVRVVLEQPTETLLRFEQSWTISDGKSITARLAAWFETPKEPPK